MASDDKKTSPAPKNGAVEKKAVAAKKDEGQPKDETTPDADRSKAESGEKAAGSPTGYSRGEGQKPVSKAYRGKLERYFRKQEKEEAIMNQWTVSLYLSEPKATFTLKYESVAVKLSLDQSIQTPTNPICPVLVSESGR
jgi:hypothetical protein